jgi:3'-phosphoadenosine 5'-phosphosulfate sulfotransferase (PAPS reductase)/FAD synthetase
MTTPDTVVSYGGGVDSTAMLVGMYQRGWRPDAILFAEVGNEWPETYYYIETVMEPWLKSVGFPDLTRVQYVPKRFKYGEYKDLYGNCIQNSTLPSLAFGRKGCSQKWKVQPMDKHVNNDPMFDEARKQGIKIKRLIGYDAGPKDSCRGGGMLEDSAKYTYVYPLRDWGWDREQCKAEIAAHNLPVPHKSACFFCPSMQKCEIHELAKKHPHLLRKAIEMEDRAQPNLTAIEGLWRNGIKGTRKPESKRPGRWRDYVEQEGLLEL